MILLHSLDRLRISTHEEFSCLLYLWAGSIWHFLQTMLVDSQFHGSTAVRGCILMENYSRPSSSKLAGRKFRSLTSVMVRWVHSEAWQYQVCHIFRSVRCGWCVITSCVISTFLRIPDWCGWEGTLKLIPLDQVAPSCIQPGLQELTPISLLKVK